MKIPRIFNRAARCGSAIALFLSPLFQSATAQEISAAAPPSDRVVWGALVSGGAEAFPYGGVLPENFDALVERLKVESEHPHFSLLNHHSEPISAHRGSWVIPAKDLFLKVEVRSATEDGSGLHLHLQAWHGKRLLSKTDATLRPAVSLIVPGPDYGSGQLFFVLRLE